jgi:hypothetical protein
MARRPAYSIHVTQEIYNPDTPQSGPQYSKKKTPLSMYVPIEPMQQNAQRGGYNRNNRNSLAIT